MVYSPSRPQSFTPTPSSANEYARPCWLCSKQKEIRAGPDSGYPVSRNLFTSGLRGSFPSRVQSLRDSCSRTPSILPPCTNLCSSVPAYGVTQLGLRSHPSGLLVPETPSTSFSFVRSDRPVYTTASIRPSGPCQPSTALAGPMFSYLRNPSPHVPGGVHDFYGHLHAGMGRSHGGFPDFGYLDPYRPQAPHQLFGARGGISCPTALGSNAPGPPGYDRYGQFDSSFVYQQTRRDTFPHLVAVDSRASPLVRGSEHNSPSKTYPRLSERDSRPPISSEPANTDRVIPTPRDREAYLQGLGTPEVDMFATLSNSHLPRFMSPIPEPRALAVDALSQDWQGRSMYIPHSPAQQSHAVTSIHSGGGGNGSLVPVSVVVPTSTTSLCGTPLVLPFRQDLLSQQDQKYISDGKSYHLHVWRLSCDTTKQQAFQTRSLGARQPLGGPQPITCTMIDGVALLDGLQDKGLIHLILQPILQPLK